MRRRGWRRGVLVLAGLAAVVALLMGLLSAGDQRDAARLPDVKESQWVAPGGSDNQDGVQPDVSSDDADASSTIDEDLVSLVVPILSAAADGWSSARVRGGLEQAASHLLGSYRDTGSCALAYADYLDLTGSTWGCVVQGPGWVDVCVVVPCEQGTCEVWTLRLDPDEAAETLVPCGEGV